MRKSGFLWHIHHDILLEWSDDIEERIKFIEKHKPKNEIPLRLRLLTPVKDKLPKEIIKEIIKAGKAYDKAGKAYDKARRAYMASHASSEAMDEAWEVYDEARRALGGAREVYNEARRALDGAREAHKSEIEILHNKECKNCPWDGYSIFKKGL